MKLIELAEPNLDAFRRREAPSPERAEHGQALVRMRAASLNFIDVLVARGAYPGVEYPLVPVADGAGEVIALGAGVRGLALGDRVAVHPKAAWHAGRGDAEQARIMRGITLPGSLIEIAAVDAASLVRAPDHLSWEQIAALPICATTAWNAMRAGAVGPGSTVALLGTGGVSIMALQLAKARGARVIITSSSDQKLARARALGADHVVNYTRSADWEANVLDVTAGQGADLVLETGGAGTFARSLAAVRQGGTIYSIGFVTGSRLELDLMPLIVKAVRVVGNNTGSAADLAEAMAAIAAHAIEPVVDQTFGLDEVAQAYRAIEAGRHFGKLAISLDW